jgi:hypothetical protein
MTIEPVTNLRICVTTMTPCDFEHDRPGSRPLRREFESASIETVDWELQVENLPPRSGQTVLIKFEQGSYRPPRIADNPEE